MPVVVLKERMALYTLVVPMDLMYFIPHNLHINTKVPPVVITRFYLFNKLFLGKTKQRKLN